MPKNNPRRIPCSQADVDKALFEGRNQGAQLMLTSVVWILCEKHDAPADDVKQLSKEIQYLIENIAARNVKFSEIQAALKDEYNWEVNFYVGEKETRNAGRI